MKKEDANRAGPFLHSTSDVDRFPPGAGFDVHSFPAVRPQSLLPTASPPWGEPGKWAEIQKRIAAALQSDKSQAENLRRLGKTLSDRIAALTPTMEELAAATCSRCPAPCCLSAKIWFDLKDLLVLHLSRGALPVAQTIANMTDRCRYIGPRGCRLERKERPWICTWYLCPTQRDRLRSDGAGAYDCLQQEMRHIGTARKKLLETFLKEKMA
jgi:hypothetical protein